MPEKSVGFAIGNLRARENRLLKKNDLSGFAAANNVTELARMLRDKGIGRTDGADVPALLHEDAEEMWKYLTGPTPPPLRLFFAKTIFIITRRCLKAL